LRLVIDGAVARAGEGNNEFASPHLKFITPCPRLTHAGHHITKRAPAEADALRKKKPRAGARGLVVRELKVASLPPSEHPINPAQPCRCGVTPLIVTNPLKYAYFASDCVTL